MPQPFVEVRAKNACAVQRGAYMDIITTREYELKEVAKILGKSPSWVRRLHYKGDIEAHEVPWGERTKLVVTGKALLSYMNKGAPDYDAAIDEWKQWMRDGIYFNKGRPMSENTVFGYTYGLETFWKALGVKASVRGITPENMRFAISAIPIKNHGKREKCHRGVMAFANYLNRKGLLTPLTLSELRELAPKSYDPPKRRSTDTEGVTKALEVLDTLYEGVKLSGSRLMVGLMAYGGLRRQEVIDLQLDQVSPGKGYMVVRGKGNKDRLVPIEPEFEKDLQKWLKLRPKVHHPNLLIQPKGTPYTVGFIRRRFDMIRKYGGEEVTSLKRIHPHALRRTCATIDHNIHGLPVELGCLKMGHNQLSTYQGYLMGTQQDLLDHSQKRRETLESPKAKPKNKHI